MAHRSLGLPVLPGARFGFPWRAAIGTGVGPWLLARLLEERERWLLWLPVGIGLGIGLYFSLPEEPPAWLGPALLLPTALAWLRPGDPQGRADHPIRQLALCALTAAALGLSAASIRTQLVAAPVLAERGAYVVEGQVLLVEERIRGQRLTLGELTLEGLDAALTPVELRVSVRGAEPALRPGDRVRLRALLMPPSPPSEPHGFDFARQAYFLRLGAVGYALSRPEVLSRADSLSWSLALSALRQAIAEEITEAVPGASGAIGVALLVGLRAALPDEIWDDWAIAGIAHLLSISGLHLALVAGTLFFSIRIALALVPPLALRLPAKKFAALLALIGTFGYLLLSGMPIPTQRSFISTALMLLAVMVDRNPFSMRLVAWAAIVVLLLQPDSMLGASFQMSFGAVVALIAVYESGAAKRPAGAGGLDWRLLMYVAGVALTTLVASAATTPFSIYHFSRFPTYGIVANLVAVPLTGVWIMPLGMLGLFLMPFGLDDFCFVLMGKGIDVIVAVAAFVAELPGAALAVPRPPLAALLATVLGGLWLCFWRTAWRRLGLIGVAIGLGLMLLARAPDLLIDARGELAAVRLDDGRLALSPWRKDRWITDGWLQSAGQDQPAEWPEAGRGGAGGLRCDAEGCVLRRHGRTVALARRPEALEADCGRTDLVISYPRLESCPDGAPLIGPAALRSAGGLALWLEPSGIESLSVREVRGERPWSR